MKEIKNKPLEILISTIGYGILHSGVKKVPGIIINKLSKESREILSKLKSNDIKNIRTDQCFGTDEWYKNDAKIKFDKQWKKWTDHLGLK
jgi:hypothetical protein